MKTIRDTIVQVCVRYSDLHDYRRRKIISHKEALQKMKEVIDQAEAEIKALMDEGEIAKIVCANNRCDTCLDHRECEGVAHAIKQWWEGK